MMVPLKYLLSDATSGCRIGGACPVGLESQFSAASTQYFGTFPLLGYQGTEFSVFHRFDPSGRDATRDLLDFNNRILIPGDLIWAVVHPKSMRSAESPNMFEPRCLTCESATGDEVSDDLGRMVPYSGCKLGGCCFVERHQVADAVKSLEKSGFVHLVQIGLVGRDFIRGFPWDPGFLNVWAEVPLDCATYRFCVQQ